MDLIKVSQLEFSYDPKVKVLDIPSFIVEKGESVFLRGPSGSGKTTFLNLLAGVLRPQKGVIEVLGNDLAKLEPSKIDQLRADHMGFIFQTLNLIPYLSPIENVTLPLSFSKLKKQKVANANEVAEDMLGKLGLRKEMYTNKKTYQLSLGQQQRVAMARAFIGSPEILIADEPTSAIDSEAKEKFLGLLLKTSKELGMTLIFVSHDMSLQDFFSKAYDLKDINQVKELSSEWL